jgi:hypothetical protein
MRDAHFKQVYPCSADFQAGKSGSSPLRSQCFVEITQPAWTRKAD